MGMAPAMLLALLAFWSAVAAAAPVPEVNSATETLLVRGVAPDPESNSATDDALVRGEIVRPPTENSKYESVLYDKWLTWLSSFLSEAPSRDSGMSEYLVASSHISELVPSDFAWSFNNVGPEDGHKAIETADEPKAAGLPVAAGPAVLDKGLAKFIYISGLFLVGLLVCWMYSERGTKVVFAVLCYMFSLSSMTLTIRNVYVNFDFHYPRWLTASHFLFTALVGLCILLHQQHRGGDRVSVPPLSQFVKGIFPVSLVFATSIGSANLGLLYSNAHFYEMVGATTALATAGFSILMGKKFDMFLMPPLLFVTLGLLICAFGEIVFSAIGFAFCAAAVVSRSFKAIIQHQLMDGDIGGRLTPVQLVVWMSFPSFVIMSLWSLYSEGVEPYFQIAQSFSIQGAVIITVINACILNTAALFVLQNLGPVAQQLAGQLKGVLSILGAVALFGEEVTMQQIVGFSIIILGVNWYNHRDMWLKQQKADTGGSAPQNVRAKAEETSPLVAQSR